tara:strand:+ start:2264 stop:2740 length:477 start_codon:yes stop_codon:yes gene_type:complete
MNCNCRFQLAICELFSPQLHGTTTNSSKGISGHLLVNTSIMLEEFYNNTYLEDISMLRQQYQGIISAQHPHIRNYANIISYDKSFKLDIIELDELEGGNEHVGYLKTHWIKCIQRKWKKVYATRKRIIRQRSSNNALREKELTGNWPKQMRSWPVLTL